MRGKTIYNYAMNTYFITGNEKKFREALEIVPGLLRFDADLPEIQSIDPEAVIAAKLREATRLRDGAFVVEDTSLFLECLGGSLPGPLIKWFLETLGARGIYDLAEKSGKFSATGVSVIGYTDGGEIHFFKGGIKGRLVPFTKGNEFGWDPVFLPDGESRTFAQMSMEEKNGISHRRRSFEKLKSFLDLK